MNTSTLFGSSESLLSCIGDAADAGFEFFGADVWTLDTWRARGGSLHELRALMRRRHVECWHVAALIVTGSEGVVRQAEHIGQWAADLSARWVVTNVLHPPDEGLVHELERAAQVLNGFGSRMALEYVPYSPLSSVVAAAELAERLGSARAGVMCDTWHHFRGPDTPDDLRALALQSLAYVEFDDALPMVSTDLRLETRDRRTFPGGGEFRLDEFVSTIKSKGFDGVVSVEVLSADWRSRNHREFAYRAFESALRWWS